MTEIQHTNIAFAQSFLKDLSQCIGQNNGFGRALSAGEVGSLHAILERDYDENYFYIATLEKHVENGTGVIVSYSYNDCLHIFHEVQSFMLGLDKKILKALGEVV